jgi:predicted nucleic acid-binding protein
VRIGGCFSDHVVACVTAWSTSTPRRPRHCAAGGQAEVEAGLAAARAGLPLRRSPHSFLLESAWRMRARVSFYDALYLALGAELGLPVITQDARLARAAAGFDLRVGLL